MTRSDFSSISFTRAPRAIRGGTESAAGEALARFPPTVPICLIWVEVTAPAAYIECDLLNKSILMHRRTTGEYQNQQMHKYRQESLVECIYVPTFEPLFLELQHYVECILDNKQPAVSARDGLKALRLVATIREAIGGCLVDVKPASN